MITKNYHRIINSAITQSLISSCVDTSGNVISNAIAESIPMLSRMSTLLSKTSEGEGVVLGTGDDEMSMDDYQLSGSVITGLQATTTISTAFDDNAASRMVEFTLSNNTSIDKTIKEVAYIGQPYIRGTRHVMLDRTVLEEPLTIPAGGVGKLRYMVEIKMPTE